MLSDIALLRPTNQASFSEVQEEFIERNKLFGLGCGFVDFTLLASTLMPPEHCCGRSISDSQAWQAALALRSQPLFTTGWSMHPEVRGLGRQPLLQHHQDPDHLTVVTGVFGQPLFEQALNKIAAHHAALGKAI
jgi:hypothetical protein